jgi:hypothetical protein
VCSEQVASVYLYKLPDRHFGERVDESWRDGVQALDELRTSYLYGPHELCSVHSDCEKHVSWCISELPRQLHHRPSSSKFSLMRRMSSSLDALLSMLTVLSDWSCCSSLLLCRALMPLLLWLVVVFVVDGCPAAGLRRAGERGCSSGGMAAMAIEMDAGYLQHCLFDARTIPSVQYYHRHYAACLQAAVQR